MHAFWNRVHNDPSRSSKVVDCSINQKRIYDFLLVLYSNLRHLVLFQFRDIRACVRRKPLFPYRTPIHAKILGCFLWSRSMMLKFANSEHLRLKLRNYFLSSSIYVMTIRQQHGETDSRSNTALCIASCCTNEMISSQAWQQHWTHKLSQWVWINSIKH